MEKPDTIDRILFERKSELLCMKSLCLVMVSRINTVSYPDLKSKFN